MSYVWFPIRSGTSMYSAGTVQARSTCTAGWSSHCPMASGSRSISRPWWRISLATSAQWSRSVVSRSSKSATVVLRSRVQVDVAQQLGQVQHAAGAVEEEARPAEQLQQVPAGGDQAEV